MLQSNSARRLDAPSTAIPPRISRERPSGKVPALVPALGLAAALALGAGEAAAQQGVYQCPAASPPVQEVFPERFDLGFLTRDHLRAIYRAAGPFVVPTEPVQCWFSTGNGNRNVVVRNPRITVTEDFTPGIDSSHPGGGDLVVYVHGISPGHPHDPVHFHPLDHGRYAVRTFGDGEFSRGEESHGVWADHSGEGRVAIDFRDMSLSTAGGDFAHGVYASQKGSFIFESGSSRRARGGVIVNVIETERDRESRARPVIGTRGDESDAIRAEYTRAAAYGHVAVTVQGYTIATGGVVPPGPQFSNTGQEGGVLLPTLNGHESRAIHARHEGRGDILVDVTDSRILTWGTAAYGIFADHTGRSETITLMGGTTEVRTGGGAVDIDVAAGEIRTEGGNAIGIYGSHRGSSVEGAGGVAIDATGATIATMGDGAHGVLGWIRPNLEDADGDGEVDDPIAGTGQGNIAITVTGGSIATAGDDAFAVWAKHENEGGIAVSVIGGATAATAGEDAHAVFAEHLGPSGDVALTIGGSIATAGEDAHGVYARNAAGSGAVTVALTGGSVTTEGTASHGVLARQTGDGAVAVRMTGGRVAASGWRSHGIEAFTAGGDVTVEINGGTVVGGTGGTGVMARSIGTEGRLRVSVGRDGTVSAASGVGIYSDSPGDLDVTVADGGRVEGDVFALGSGTNRVNVEEGGYVSGSVNVATPVFAQGRTGIELTMDGAVGRAQRRTGSAVTIDGEVGRVRLQRGGMLTVGSGGRIRGIDDIAVSSGLGGIDIVVEIDATGRQGRVEGRIVADNGQERVLVRRADGTLVTLRRDMRMPSGVFDVGIVDAAEGGIRFGRDVAPRARLYEALPAVLLGMNGMPDFQDRTAAPRNAKGGWARVEAAGGDWKAHASSTRELAMEERTVGLELEYDYRRYGIQVGLDVPMGEDRLLGVSLHHRRGSAKVRNGGDVKPSGTGAGVSHTWSRDGGYTDVRAEATYYETDFSSSLRGPLKDGVKGIGWALGVETGQRVALPDVDGVVLIPRTGLVYSRVSLDEFEDAVGERTSLEQGQSLKGRLGMGVEMKLNASPESRLIGSLDVEHEFKDETEVRVSGTELKATAEATRLRMGLDGVHSWGEGRYALQGGMSYAVGGGGNYEIGGELSLEVRF